MVNQIAIAPCFFIFFSVFVHAQQTLVPAFYIFGDSFVDPGNNKFLKTDAQADYPYGIDHPLGVTGRWTNGLTAVDYIAQWMGLNFQPPAMDPKFKLHPTYQGINYGSGSAGLLPEAGRANVLCLKEQVDLFKEAVKEQLTPHFEDPAKLADHLSRSLFYIHMGHNDYGFLYNGTDPIYRNKYNPKQFADLLLTEMESNVKVLYELGARKIIISEIAPFGCSPGAFSDPTTSPPTGCIDARNNLPKIFNSELATKLQDLGPALKGSTFVIAKDYDVIFDVAKNPKQYGILEVRNPCKARDTTSFCKDRNSYAYWDDVHPTQVVYKILATKCFNGTDVCIPMNIQELAKKKP